MNKEEENKGLDRILLELGYSDRSFFDSLPKHERDYFLKVISELSKEGSSESLDIIWEIDYEEKPVDIMTFMSDDYFLGKIYKNNLFDGWVPHLEEIYSKNNNYLEICLVGDTEIFLPTGEVKTMKELAENKKDFFVYSVEKDTGKLKINRAFNPKKTRKNAEVWCVTLDNGEKIIGTPDHNLIDRNLNKVKIKDLKKGDSLFPFRTKLSTTKEDKSRLGYTMIYSPNEEKWVWAHYLSDQYNLRKNIYDKDSGGVRHHKDFNKLNNSPNNIERMGWWEHNELHYQNGGNLKKLWKEKWFQELVSETSSKILTKRWKNKEYKESHLKKLYKGRDKFLSTQEGKDICIKNLKIFNEAVKNKEEWALDIVRRNGSKGSDLLWNSDDPKYKNSRKKHKESLRSHMINSNQAKEMAKAAWSGESGKSLREKKRNQFIKMNKNHPNRRDDITIESITDYCRSVQEVKVSDISKEFNCSFSKVRSVIREKYKSIHEFREIIKNYNHKVVSVEFYGYEDVYNFTVEEDHMYFLNAGVLSANCITGAIGLGKSNIVTACMLYDLYNLLCLRSPQSYYGLTHTSPIAFALFNITLSLAGSVGTALWTDHINSSPYFRDICTINPRKKNSLEFPKNIKVLSGSRFTHALGQNVFAAFLDEVNFGKDVDKGDEIKSQMLDNYTNLLRRMESRFKDTSGRIPGHMFLVSSKKTESDFLERHIEENKHKPTMYVIDEPIYNIKTYYFDDVTQKKIPRFCGENFRVLIGDQKLDSRILSDNEIAPEGYTVIDVPIEYRDSFESKIDGSIRDIAGKATTSTSSLIKDRETIRNSINKDRTPIFPIQTVFLPFSGDEQLIDYMDTQAFEEWLEENPTAPRAVHIDIGYSEDALGLAVGHFSGTTKISRTSIDLEHEEYIEPVVKIDLYIRVKNVKGQKLPLDKITRFVFDLKFKFGLEIIFASTDGFQSEYMRQKFESKGMKAAVISVDRTDDPYLNLRQIHSEGRIDIYDYDFYLIELFSLIHNAYKNKVDHGERNIDGSKGSKDLADAISGVCAALYKDKRFLENINTPSSRQIGNMMSELYKETKKHSPYVQDINQLMSDEDEDEYMSDHY